MAVPPNSRERDELIAFFFRMGYTVKESIGSLLLLHHMVVSERTVRRVLKRLNLGRRLQDSLVRIVKAIRFLHRHGYSELGYRWIWRLVNMQFGIRAFQSTVRQALLLIDPMGVQLRLRRRLRRRLYVNPGPNFLIHIDGYDKLKPYGISIHGAIDGFSRKIIWLVASSSNKNPRFISHYYMDFIKKIRRVPRQIRADHGTENCIVRDIQRALRMHHVDTNAGLNSFTYGRSTGNQRIEMLWSILRNSFTSFWRNLFRDMIDENLLDTSDPVHIQCILLCFLKPIQRHLDNFRELWNSHRIRQQRNVETVSGIPNLLYDQPLLYGTHDYSFELPCGLAEIDQIAARYTEASPTIQGCSEEMLRLATLTSGLQEDFYIRRRTPVEAKHLFQIVLSNINPFL